MRVLVVEDQLKLSSFIQKGLEEAGFLVNVAATCSEAEQLSADHEFDCMVLDVMLPDGTGLDLVRTFRQHGYLKPILLLTALGGTQDKVNGLDSGADDYLTKPFAFDELLARLRALMRRPQMGASTGKTLSCLDLQMDLVERKISRGGQAIDLTQKEFSLLRYLLQHRNRPVSRTELLEHVWDVHFDQGSNVVDVYMNMLRKKVDHPFEKKLLHTVVGFGYVLKEGE